jgi:hypothetical protein
VNQTYKIIAASVALLLAAFFGHWITNNHWQAKWSKHIEQDAAQVLAANEAIRAKERQWQDKLNEASKDAKLREQQLKIDSDELGATVDGLLSKIELLTANSKTASAAIAESGRSAATDKLVYKELLVWSIGANQELSRYADENRSAALTCEAAYNALRL